MGPPVVGRTDGAITPSVPERPGTEAAHRSGGRCEVCALPHNVRACPPEAHAFDRSYGRRARALSTARTLESRGAAPGRDRRDQVRADENRSGPTPRPSADQESKWTRGGRREK